MPPKSMDPAAVARRRAYEAELNSAPLFRVMPDNIANNGVPFSAVVVAPGGPLPFSSSGGGTSVAVVSPNQQPPVETVAVSEIALSAIPTNDSGNSTAVRRTCRPLNLEIVPSLGSPMELSTPMNFTLTSTSAQQSQANAPPAAPTSNPFASLGASTQNQQQPTTSLFGNTSNQATTQSTSLFGNTATSNQTQTQPTNSLFGNTNTQNTAQPASNPFGNTSSNSLFGNTLGGQNNQAQTSSSSLFGKPPNTNQAPAAGSSMFGASLLGAAQHNNLNQSQPFGRLSMGQNSANQNQTVGAAKVDLNSLRPTTRYEDCIDEVKQEMENIDKMIQRQEQFAKEIEAFFPQHSLDVASIAPDVDFIRDKAEDVESALASDAQGVDAQRKHADKDVKDLERCQRIITNLSLPQGFQYSGMNPTGYGSMYGSQQRPAQQPSSSTSTGDGSHTYDTDLINNYFVPKAAEMQGIMDMYATNLAEIEQHMRVIEMSSVQQAQQLAQRRSGGQQQQVNGNETVRELADTLRGFEESILGVAGVVGESRDGVNELVLGRLGGR